MIRPIQRKAKGQSMVEYALGIGCVAAVCLYCFAGLGHASADVVRQVSLNINDADDTPTDPGSILTSPINSPSNPPWAPK